MVNKIIGEAKGIFNVITLFEITIALIYIIVGILFFTNSTASNTLVSIITGFILIIHGVSAIFSYLRRGDIELFNLNLIFGIILIVLGIVAMFLGKVLSIALGIYLIIGGSQKISYSYFLKKFNESSWVFNLVVGILCIILGVTTFFTSGDKIIEVAGICMLGYGVIDMINVILLRKRSTFFIA